MVQIFNQKKSMILIQRHFFRSHLAVVCSGANVSMEIVQMVLGRYQSYDSSKARLKTHLFDTLTLKNVA